MVKKGPASANTNSGAERGRRRLDRGCDHGESGQEKRPSKLRGGAKPVGGLANDAEHMRKGGGPSLRGGEARERGALSSYIRSIPNKDQKPVATTLVRTSPHPFLGLTVMPLRLVGRLMRIPTNEAKRGPRRGSMCGALEGRSELPKVSLKLMAGPPVRREEWLLRPRDATAAEIAARWCAQGRS